MKATCIRNPNRVVQCDAIETGYSTRGSDTHLCLLDHEVVSSLRDDLDELGQVALVRLELEAVHPDDVGADVVEEALVVRDHDGGHVLERVEVLLDPRDVGNVEVVGRLVLQGAQSEVIRAV